MRRDFDYFCTRVKLAWDWRWARLKNRQRDLRLDWELGRISKVESRLLEEARALHDQKYRNMSYPLVSVIIPTYNRGGVLVERTLPSVFNQTYQNFEIVIVGDCCSDDTEERVNKIGDPRIRFYNLPERYRYPKNPQHMRRIQGFNAGNLAIQRAAGDWLAYMDDDDIWLPGHTEELLNFAMAENYELIFARHEVETTPGAWEQASGNGGFPTGRRPFRGNPVPHRTVIYRSYLRFFQYRGDAWKYRIPGDYLMWLHMGRAGVRAGFLDKAVALKPLRAPYTEVARNGSSS
jgi:glycosyltransferase involved in cell wall biosynthesis